MSKQVKVGLALGSGSARGFAHIGILQTLEEEGISVDCIAGTSIGAIVGSVYAATGTLQNYQEILEQFDWKKVTLLLDPLFPVSGLLGGKRLEKLFDSLLPKKNIEDFEVPFAVVAADVASGEEVVITEGNAVTAIRASMSMPGIFAPVFFRDHFLVDGGIVSPVPVRAARMLGADVVIAVNLAADMSKRSYISTAKDTAKQFQAIEKAQADEKTFFDSLRDTVDLPEFLKGTVEKGKSFVEEQAQAIEQWFDEKVERGRSVVSKKSSFLYEWLKEEEEHAADLPDIFSTLFNSINIMQYTIAKSNLQQYPPDVLLEPDLAKVRLLDFDRAEECIREGKRITREVLPRIREIVKE